MVLDDELKNKLKEAISGHADVARLVADLTLATGKHWPCLDQLVTADVLFQLIADIVADKIMKDVYSGITKANAIDQTAVALELEQLYGKYGNLHEEY